jgi:hypothetical protein
LGRARSNLVTTWAGSEVSVRQVELLDAEGTGSSSREVSIIDFFRSQKGISPSILLVIDYRILWCHVDLEERWPLETRQTEGRDISSRGFVLGVLMSLLLPRSCLQKGTGKKIGRRTELQDSWVSYGEMLQKPSRRTPVKDDRLRESAKTRQSALIGYEAAARRSIMSCEETGDVVVGVSRSVRAKCRKELRWAGEPELERTSADILDGPD